MTEPTNRKTLLTRALALLLASSPAGAIATACGDGDGMGGGMMDEGRMDPAMRQDMRVIRRLLSSHDDIRRSVEEVPGGVLTTTVSSRADIRDLIRSHVRQMHTRIERGRPIRRMDPLFREIFEHADKIRMEIEDIPGGVRVRETSEDPQVVLLIRQHATRAVSEFVEEGMSRAMEPTPLPRGYRRD